MTGEVAPASDTVWDARPRPDGSPVLSPSRAGDFLTCPLLYRFRVVDQIKEPPSLAATRGSVVHTVLEQLYDLPTRERTPAAARALIRPAWLSALAADPALADLVEGDVMASFDQWEREAEALLETYYALEDPTRLQPAKRELYVAAEVAAGLWLHGFVDRLDISPAGDIRVVDYKTGRAPGAGFEAKALFQLRCYALVIWEMTARLPTVLQLVYLGSGEVLRHQPDIHDLESTRRKVAALWAAIQRAHATGDFRPRRSPLCSWCSHQNICPEWGGTPPQPPPNPAPPGQSSVRH